jgi:beta-lactamase class A
VTGVKGRHSAGASGVRSRRLLVVVGGLLALAAITVGALAWSAGGQARRPATGSLGGQARRTATGVAVEAGQRASGPAVRPKTATPTGRGSPAPAPAQAQRDPFGTAATSYLSARTGTVLAAVYDVGTGRSWRLGQGRAQATASVVKLDILETLLAEQGRGAGLPAGDQSLAQQMMEDSDNTAATSLWYQAGGPARIGVFNTAAGLSQTALSPCVVCRGFAWPGWGLSTTTPADQIALLRKLITPSTLLTATERAYALSLMENVTPAQRWGVSGGVPAQVTVALKNGWLPLEGTDGDWQINSVGWVAGGGRNYLMAVLTTGNPTEQYGIDTIDRLAAMVWQAMK